MYFSAMFVVIWQKIVRCIINANTKKLIPLGFFKYQGKKENRHCGNAICKWDDSFTLWHGPWAGLSNGTTFVEIGSAVRPWLSDKEKANLFYYIRYNSSLEQLKIRSYSGFIRIIYLTGSHWTMACNLSHPGWNFGIWLLLFWLFCRLRGWTMEYIISITQKQAGNWV